MANGKKDGAGTTAVATTPAAGALAAMPDWMRADDVRGREGLTADDVKIPRVALAQAQSPEVMRGDPKHVAGLVAGQLFNNVTGANYGERLRAIPIKAQKRAMEWWPRPADGAPQGALPKGIKDRHVPWDDPRCRFKDDPTTGASTKPTATRYYEYVAYLPDTDEIVMLSFSKTQTGTAKQINTIASLGKGPLFARVWEISTLPDRRDQYNFFNTKATLLGWNEDRAVYAKCEAAFEAFAAKDVTTEYDEDEADPLAAPAPAEGATRVPGEDDDV